MKSVGLSGNALAALRFRQSATYETLKRFGKTQ